MIEELKYARDKQYEVKANLLKARRVYESAKSEIYLKQMSQPKMTHFLALAVANTNKEVQQLRIAMEDLEIEHNRAWSDVNIIVLGLGHRWPTEFDPTLNSAEL